VDQDPAVQVRLNSIDELRTNANLQQETAIAAAKRLANSVDATIISTVSGTGSIPTDVVTSYDTLIEARSTLTTNGVAISQKDMFFFSSALQTQGMLKDDDIQEARMHFDPSNALVTGQIGVIGGINVIEQSVTAGGGILFHRDALAFVSQQAIEFELDSMLGGQKIRGNILGAFMLYGVKVLSVKGVMHITDS
jgi:hypothetical protein